MVDVGEKRRIISILQSTYYSYILIINNRNIESTEEWKEKSVF